MSRYARQMQLPDMGPEGQARLARARVLVVGAGGLGCPALQYLVGAGVGQITIVDADVVSVTNLHRQILYREDDVNHPKAQRAAETLAPLNSEVVLTPVIAALTPSNAPALVADHDIVLDCADSFAVSYILSDICKGTTPLISASALGSAGYVGGFCGPAPSLRAVFPDLPQRAATCATAGVMGPVVGMLGAAQAQMTLGVLLGHSPSPLGQMLSFDMGSLKSSQFRFDAAPDPEPDMIFIAPNQITSNDWVVDLRAKAEGPLVTPEAQRMVVADFDSPPTPTGRAVLTCRSGLRAWQAGTRLRATWDGPITLIALGDTPGPSFETERQPS